LVCRQSSAPLQVPGGRKTAGARGDPELLCHLRTKYRSYHLETQV